VETKGLRNGRFVSTNGARQRLFAAWNGKQFLFSIGGRSFRVERVDAAKAAAGAADVGEPFAVSPMSGLVTKVHVVPGDRVAKGAPLFAVEAMKMEYVVKADRDVVIADVKVKAGARVGINEPGVTFAAPGSP
jgi:biotin carboxyl carrier protein